MMLHLAAGRQGRCRAVRCGAVNALRHGAVEPTEQRFTLTIASSRREVWSVSPTAACRVHVWPSEDHDSPCTSQEAAASRSSGGYPLWQVRDVCYALGWCLWSIEPCLQLVACMQIDLLRSLHSSSITVVSWQSQRTLRTNSTSKAPGLPCASAVPDDAR